MVVMRIEMDAYQIIRCDTQHQWVYRVYRGVYTIQDIHGVYRGVCRIRGGYDCHQMSPTVWVPTTQERWWVGRGYDHMMANM